MKTIILLPAYNEAENFPVMFEKIEKELLNKLDFDIVIVNDGSTDNTKEVIKRGQDKLPIILLSHEKNKGLGLAMRTGFEYISQKYSADDIVMALDADNTHDLVLVFAHIKKIAEGYDISIASRYCQGGKEIGLSFYRKLLSRGASLLFSLVFAIPGVRDYTCGFRAYKLSILKRGFEVFGASLIEENGFACMTEILVKLYSIGAKIAEIPLVLRYDLKQGASKMKIMETIHDYYFLIKKKEKIFQMGRDIYRLYA